MSYQVFARKYRPQTFEDVLGQDHVVQTLRNAISQNRLAHAYLFVGPRGTGKTSTARIFAKALNAPGGPSASFDPDDPLLVEIAEGRSLDVLEIDGASNNGVEQVRELRETVQYAPANAPFKIYYIDEVHMLSNAAFNALLKTLEEPPAHVKFIFATTEPNKILPTIISRCQRFDLRPIPTHIIATHLQTIAKNEGVTLDDPAAWAIAKGADGGMRDAQSMLDQLVAFCGETISEENVQHIFGFTSGETIVSILTAILAKNPSSALNELEDLAKSGKNLTQILTELVNTLRSLLIHKIDPKARREGLSEELWLQLVTQTENLSADRLLKLIDVLSSSENGMRWASNKQLHLELALIRATQTLDEIRISDVITSLERGGLADHADQPTTPSLVAPDTAQKKTAPAKKSGDKLGALDRLMEDAPEERPQLATPEPTPAPPESISPEPTPATQEPPSAESDDDFRNDPLIQDAIEIFDGKLK
ncbi:MAG: DNA polymerase III subunit gamma/tau [Verrucomicrobiota bacterium]